MLHRLQELLLVILALPGCLLVQKLGVRSCCTFVEVLSACLCHRSSLVLQLQGPFGREPNFMLLLHLINLRLLLLQYVWQL